MNFDSRETKHHISLWSTRACKPWAWIGLTAGWWNAPDHSASSSLRMAGRFWQNEPKSPDSRTPGKKLDKNKMYWVCLVKSDRAVLPSRKKSSLLTNVGQPITAVEVYKSRKLVIPISSLNRAKIHPQDGGEWLYWLDWLYRLERLRLEGLIVNVRRYWIIEEENSVSHTIMTYIPN